VFKSSKPVSYEQIELMCDTQVIEQKAQEEGGA
jgi:hypothetical protein